jgi:plasmid stabilization system protein ParE
VDGDELWRGGTCEPQPLDGYPAARCALAKLDDILAKLAARGSVERLRKLSERLQAHIDSAADALRDGAQRDESRARRGIKLTLGRLRAIAGRVKEKEAAEKLRSVLSDIRQVIL